MDMHFLSLCDFFSPISSADLFYFFFKHFIYLFLERGQGREKERETNVDVWEKHRSFASHTPPTGTWPVTQACALTGNQTSDILVCRTMLNPLSHTSQGSSVDLNDVSTYCQTISRDPELSWYSSRSECSWWPGVSMEKRGSGFWSLNFNPNVALTLVPGQDRPWVNCSNINENPGARK